CRQRRDRGKRNNDVVSISCIDRFRRTGRLIVLVNIAPSNSLGKSIRSAQYSRIENSKTGPTVTTLEKIAKALGVSLSDLFASTDELKEINSYDKSIMEKVALLEALDDNEKQTIYTMLDAFIGKKKLRDALSGVLKDVE
ncbi:MAG: helix-turn-helix domain-containing protein, partial [Bacteroidales bacterium]